MKDYKHVNGKTVVDKIKVPMHQLKITWYTPEGEIADKDTDGRSWLFKAEGPGIITEQVRNIEFPSISYTSTEKARYATVYQYVVKD
jgi:hypothetical protein